MNNWLAFRLLAAAGVAGLALTACGSSDGSPQTAGSAPVAPKSSGPSPLTSEPSRTAAPADGTAAPTHTAGPVDAPPLDSWSLKPLWPFATLAQVREWERLYRADGHQPWHLDPTQTALSFTRDFLGFKGIDRVSSTKVEGRHARVGVAYSGAESGTAAVIHLVHFGAGPDAPWEVVGTDDTTFSLSRPAYGSLASSPLVTGGRITGVDETIRVSVHQLSSAAPLGTSPCCVPAGGHDQPWTATVAFSAPRDPVLTVVASTGGHVADVERFSITAVRTR
ncbi:hypothetical protein [Streptomyces sp. NPDC006879]|uniref:hypothetical protein n=1 Tax=Streptomyces sp. NPDC006879 TaxID=3364767 RepID=UPI0036A4C045